MTPPLIDPFGREINYLRVSVTDRCDFRCVYCMAEAMTFLPKAEILTLEELDRVCSAFVRRGVRKLRLTGGEPLVRRNIMSLFRSLSRHLASGAGPLSDRDAPGDRALPAPPRRGGHRSGHRTRPRPLAAQALGAARGPHDPANAGLPVLGLASVTLYHAITGYSENTTIRLTS